MKRRDEDSIQRVLCRLLALNLMIGKTKGERIDLLTKAGMGRKEIAELVESTVGTVSVQQSLARKRERQKNQKPIEIAVQADVTFTENVERVNFDAE